MKALTNPLADEGSNVAGEYLARARSHIDAGRPREALAALQIAYGSDHSQATAHRVSGLADGLDARKTGLTSVRVAYLSDHLIGPLPTLLRAQSLLSGLLVESYVPDFDTWQQEIADPASRFYGSQPEVVILDLTLERLAPELVASFVGLTPVGVDDLIARTTQAITAAMDELRRRLPSARVLVHSFIAPSHPVLGIYDRLAAVGQVDAVDRLNASLRREARERGDVYVVELAVLAAAVGQRFFDRRMYVLAKLPYGGEGLAVIALEHAKYLRALFGCAKKVLVLDADNTLWGGIVGEDGVEGIRLNEDSPARGYLDFQRYAAELARRGVVLALASSNDQSDVLEVFRVRPEMVLRESDFAIIVANWKDKAQNLLDIARELDLATQSFVFVDDDPVQCARVRDALPEIAVLQFPADPLGATDALARWGWFDTLALTTEDRQRNALYRSDVARQEFARNAGSPDEFLDSLGVRLFVARLGPGSLARAASLTQRTNQFNLTTRRYTEADLQARCNDSSWIAMTARLVDRFGDIGTIGLMMLHLEDGTATIDTFLLSCRALRRRVEDALLALAVAQAQMRGSSRIVGIHVPTAKNTQTATFYPAHGFVSLDETADGGRRWVTTSQITFPAGVSVAYEGQGW